MDGRLLFVNVGWMVSYRGPANDPTLGGHGWLKDHDYGHEAWNFLPHKGRVYGYVPRSARINLRRLGAPPRAEQVDGVTVVWIARSPRNGVTYVVGWYRDATVHRDNDHEWIMRSPGRRIEYQISAAEDRATLLGPDQRGLTVPTAKKKGNLGQSPVWYGNPEFNEQVRAYLKAGGIVRPPSAGKARGGARQPDPEVRKRIETAAVDHATAYYESREGGGWTVESVENQGLGWDLDVTRGDDVLRVEVKGLSGREVCVELTPNEFKKMLSPEHRSDYVVYIVTEADQPQADSHVFSYNRPASSRHEHVWATTDGRRLRIDIIEAARLTAY